MYRENPKTKGSGIVCVIPQKERCKVGCDDCFFNSGRSYLEPLDENLPNIPPALLTKVYRINDGNDSSIDVETVLRVAQKFPMRFYNTSFTEELDRFDAPVVLTVNPGPTTDKSFHKNDNKKLMFVRFRCNTWNFRTLGTQVIMWYAERHIPVVLTFMAYEKIESIPEIHRGNYERKKRTINDYWVVKYEAWKRIMESCEMSNYGRWVESCGTSEEHECRFCGNCLKHYFKKMEELR